MEKVLRVQTNKPPQRARRDEERSPAYVTNLNAPEATDSVIRGGPMAHFIFQLDGVLRHRKHIEQQRQRESGCFAGAEGACEAEIRATTRDPRRSATADVACQPSDRPARHGISWRRHRRYMLAVQRRGRALSRNLAGLQKQVQESQLRWPKPPSRGRFWRSCAKSSRHAGQPPRLKPRGRRSGRIEHANDLPGPKRALRRISLRMRR